MVGGVYKVGVVCPFFRVGGVSPIFGLGVVSPLFRFGGVLVLLGGLVVGASTLFI